MRRSGRPPVSIALRLSIAWAEELIEPARAIDHPWLAFLYVMATHCLVAGRVEDALRYSDAGQIAVLSSAAPPSGFEGWLGGAYVQFGPPERAIEMLHSVLARGWDPYAVAGTGLVFALMRAGSQAQAIAAAKDLIDAADDIPNPWARSFVCLMS